MFNKTLENLKNLATKKLNAEDIVNEVKARSESIGKLTNAEREKILDKLVGKILQGQDLGDNGDAIRTKIRARLFDKQEGDALFLSNLKYINEVLTGSLPRSLSDLSGFRDTLAAKLVQDAKGGKLPTQSNTNRAAGKGDGSGRGQGPRGEFDRGRRGDRRPHRNNERRDNNNQDSGRGGASHREANASNQQAKSHDEAPKSAHSNSAPAHSAPAHSAPAHSAPSETTHAADRQTESAPE